MNKTIASNYEAVKGANHMEKGAIKFIGRRAVYRVPYEWDGCPEARRRESDRSCQSDNTRRPDEEAVQRRNLAGRE
ncbi:protein of unknown function [Methylocaldum szegediense]|uniref:Uncharacterized protein n=1 Tax=Methylocaldum szegediense TaxID=73780 RepID=A0ABM9I179_9GAMM|nr:protein of unknown function [Methylocaldum szegediense]